MVVDHHEAQDHVHASSIILKYIGVQDGPSYVWPDHFRHQGTSPAPYRRAQRPEVSSSTPHVKYASTG